MYFYYCCCRTREISVVTPSCPRIIPAHLYACVCGKRILVLQQYELQRAQPAYALTKAKADLRNYLGSRIQPTSLLIQITNKPNSKPRGAPQRNLTSLVTYPPCLDALPVKKTDKAKTQHHCKNLHSTFPS